MPDGELVLQTDLPAGSKIVAFVTGPSGDGPCVTLRVEEADLPRPEESSPNLGPVLVERVHPRDGDVVLVKYGPESTVVERERLAQFLRSSVPRRAAVALIPSHITIHDLTAEDLHRIGLEHRRHKPSGVTEVPLTSDQIQLARDVISSFLASGVADEEAQQPVRELDAVLLEFESRST